MLILTCLIRPPPLSTVAPIRQDNDNEGPYLNINHRIDLPIVRDIFDAYSIRDAFTIEIKECASVGQSEVIFLQYK